MANNLLLIPVQIDSLFLEKDALMAEATADFSRLPFFNGRRDVNPDVAYVSENFVSPPLQNRNQRFRAGLHLHWALPDAMTRGLVRDTDPDNLPGGMPIPAVPDRWLIQRNDNHQWLVESNFLWPTESVFETLEPVKELLKKTLRKVRAFDSLAKGSNTQLDLKTLEAYRQETHEILTTVNGMLAEILNKPETAFFESLYILIECWKYLFADIKRIERTDDFPKRLESYLYDYFNGRKDAVSYPVRPEDIRRLIVPDSKIAEQRIRLQLALRQANFLTVMNDLLEEADRKDRIGDIRKNLEAFADSFIIRVTPTSGANGLTGKIGWLLARDARLPADTAGNKPAKTLKRFHKLTQDDINDILNRSGGGAFGPEKIDLLKKDSIDGDGFLSFRENVFAAAETLREGLDNKTAGNLTEALLAMLKAYSGPGDQAAPAPAHPQPYRFLGRSYRLLNVNILEDTGRLEYLLRLTTLGYGEPTFAAFYPNCHSVFGFFDPNITKTSLPSYHIFGWYADEKDELLPFLKNLYKPEALDVILKEQARWEMPENGLVDENCRVVCFGHITHKDLTEGKQEELVANTQIAVANTGQEALAALLASKIGTTDDERKGVEDQLEALFLSDAFANRQLDIWPKFLETRHEQGFNAEPGERIWHISPKRVEIATSINSPGGDNPVSPKLPDEIAGQLSELNQKQRAFDLAVFERETLREQLFSDWYKYMLSAYPPQDSRLDYPDVDEVRYFIEQFDIRPLLDLQFQTGLFSETPAQRWIDLGFQEQDDLKRPTPPLLSGMLEGAKKAVEKALRDHNTTLSATLAAEDIADWNRLIGALSSHKPSAAGTRSVLDDLFTRIRESELGPALMLLQDIKGNILQALIKGRDEKASDVEFILQRFGVPLEEGENTLSEKHIVQWNALLHLLLSGKSIKKEVLDFKKRLPGSLLNKIGLFLEPAVPGGPAPADQLAMTGANLTLMLDQIKEAIKADPVNRRDELAAALSNALRPAPRFELQSNNGPRFWQPKEPTLLIAGDIATASNRFGRDGRLNNGLLKLEAWQILEHTGDIISKLQNLVELVDSKAPEDPKQDAIGYNSSNGAPWNPFLMEWSVELLPLQEHSNARDGEYQDDYVLHNYELPVNAVDLREKTITTIRGRNPNIYLGNSLLSADAFQNLSEKLKPYLEKHAADTAENDLKDPLHVARQADPLLSGLKDKILSQSLGGFNAAMVMLKETFQLPVDDPIGFADYQQFTNAVAQLVGGADQRAPNPLTDFSPIRTGALQINQLRLVDTFGRIADLIKENTDGSTELKVDFTGSSLGKSNIDDKKIRMNVPPRLAQAARLHFRWLSAENEANETSGQATGSPVCGWFMANQLDRSLLVFDARGASLGAIENESSGDGKARWRPTPGWESLLNPEDISNSHLKKVVAYLINQGGDFIEKFIDETNAVLRRIEPESFEQQQSLALLMGRPIALVRANIDLELKGAPAVHQGWNAFYRDRKDNTVERETDRYTQVRFPIRIGAVDQLNDGLICYWLEKTDNTEHLKGNLYLNNHAGTSPHTAIHYLSNDTPISQSLDVNDKDQSVCILMDPRAKVHAFSGILPAKVIDIPAAQYLDALKAIDITFLTTPILTPASRISVSRPSEKGYEWQWIEQTAEKTAPQDKGKWLEIRDYPVIPEKRFLDIFSNILLQHIRLCNWLDTEGKALPLGKRAALSPEFSLLDTQLKDLTPAGKLITPELLHPIGQSLLNDVLLKKNTLWLVKAPTEGPDTIYRILPKEQRGPDKFDQTEFAGFESRINAILHTEYMGFRSAVPDGHFFPETVTIREGWMKLKRGD